MELAHAADHNRFVGRSRSVGEWIADADGIPQSSCRTISLGCQQRGIARCGICRIALVIAWRCGTQPFGICGRCGDYGCCHCWCSIHLGIDSLCGSVCTWQCHSSSHRCDDGISCYGDNRSAKILQCRRRCQGIRCMGIRMFHPYLWYPTRSLLLIDVHHPSNGNVADKNYEYIDVRR